MERSQPPRTATDPIRQGRAVELDALAGIDLRLAIKRRVIGVLGNDHMGDQGLGRQTAFDQPWRRGRLYDRARTVATGVFGPADQQYAELLRDHIESLRDILADRVKRAAAARATLVIDIDDHLDPRQMVGQRAAIDLPLANRSGVERCRLFFLRLGRGNALL